MVKLDTIYFYYCLKMYKETFRHALLSKIIFNMETIQHNGKSPFKKKSTKKKKSTLKKDVGVKEI